MNLYNIVIRDVFQHKNLRDGTPPTMSMLFDMTVNNSKSNLFWIDFHNIQNAWVIATKSNLDIQCDMGLRSLLDSQSDQENKALLENIKIAFEFR